MLLSRIFPVYPVVIPLLKTLRTSLKYACPGPAVACNAVPTSILLLAALYERSYCTFMETPGAKMYGP